MIVGEDGEKIFAFRMIGLRYRGLWLHLESDGWSFAHISSLIFWPPDILSRFNISCIGILAQLLPLNTRRDGLSETMVLCSRRALAMVTVSRGMDYILSP